MNRRQADAVAGVLIAGVLAAGVLTAVQLGTSDGATPGGMQPPPLMRWVGPVFASLVVASVVGGIYVYVRGQVFEWSTEVPEPGGNAGGQPAAGESTAGSEPRPGLLDVLPDDERRILSPVIESPGITQTKVVDRSGFSRSKVSQTVTELEERGLLYRERQGRTYRVYPADDLETRL